MLAIIHPFGVAWLSDALLAIIHPFGVAWLSDALLAIIHPFGVAWLAVPMGYPWGHSGQHPGAQ